MKFSDFKDINEILTHFGLIVQKKQFLDTNGITPVPLAKYFVEDLYFTLCNRGDTDKWFYACEAFIFPFLKEAWKRHPKAKLFSHPEIKYGDSVFVPDYVLCPTDQTGAGTFKNPLLITVFAHHDNYGLGWFDAYKQLIVARSLNENPEIPIYAIVSIGTGWEFGKLEDNVIRRNIMPIGFDNPNKLLGVLDFIFADCVRTAEKFDMY